MLKLTFPHRDGYCDQCMWHYLSDDDVSHCGLYRKGKENATCATVYVCQNYCPPIRYKRASEVTCPHCGAKVYGFRRRKKYEVD